MANDFQKKRRPLVALETKGKGSFLWLLSALRRTSDLITVVRVRDGSERAMDGPFGAKSGGGQGQGTPSRRTGSRLEGYDNYPGGSLFIGQPDGGNTFKTPERAPRTPGLGFDESASSFTRSGNRAPPSSGRRMGDQSMTQAPAGEDFLPSKSLLDGVNSSMAPYDEPATGNNISMNSFSNMGAPESASGDACWVIVFGFPASQTSQVIEEFLACGQIVSHHQDSPLSNHVRVEFQTSMGAQRALTRDGSLLATSPHTMVGVRRHTGPLRVPTASTGLNASSQALYLQPQRSAYSVTSNAFYDFSPYPHDTFWSRFKYYVLGI